MSGRRSNIIIKNAEEIKKIEIACRIVADTLVLLEKYVKHGVSTLELDKIAEDFIKTQDGIPAFKGYQVDDKFFPGSLCISVDEEVVHGLPSERKLKEGEIVSLDCGVLKNGYYGDSAVTYPVGKVSDDKNRLMRVTEESLYLGIDQARENKKIYDIARAIQNHCEKNGFSLTRELVGHGIGKNLHEDPAVPNFVPALLYKNRFPNEKLVPGMAIAIEPMVHFGRKEVRTATDGWTVRTFDKSPAAHFEHTIVITQDKPLILTSRN